MSLRERIGKLACELCDPADLEQMCIPYNAMPQCNTRKRRVDAILAAVAEEVESMPRTKSPNRKNLIYLDELVNLWNRAIEAERTNIVEQLRKED